MKLSHTRFMKFSKCMSRSGTIQSGIYFLYVDGSGQKKARKDEFL